eukprot:5600961-Prymnesium_polylepis.2
MPIRSASHQERRQSRRFLYRAQPKFLWQTSASMNLQRATENGQRKRDHNKSRRRSRARTPDGKSSLSETDCNLALVG